MTIITDETILYIDEKKVMHCPEVIAHLAEHNVQFRPYETFVDDLTDYSRNQGLHIMVDTSSASYALYRYIAQLLCLSQMFSYFSRRQCCGAFPSS